MGLVSNCTGVRIDIASWVMFLLNCTCIAALIRGRLEHVQDLTHNPHQPNQLVGLETGPSASCEFKGSLCGYRIIRDVRSQNVTWLLLSNNLNNTQHSPKGNCVALVGTGAEGERSFIQSPNFQTTSKNRVEFFYYLSGDNPGQIQLTFIQNNTKIGHRLWSVWEDHGAGLNYGCMELPANRTGHLMFTGILGSSTERIVAVQKVSISQGSCERGVQRSTCTFDNVLLCNYALNCTAFSEYTWRRYKGATPTFGTGPSGDVVEPFNGFYLYAESSYGSQGDSASIRFPVRNTKGRHLHFWYHMYGKGIGSLRLRYHFGQSSKEEWTESGEQGDKWRYFCLQIVDDVDAFSLIAVRGSSYLGDIAIDNVRVDDKNCQNGSLDCNFKLPFICGYSIVGKWERVKDANGFIMTADKFAGEHSMTSPTIDVLDSCVRIYYRIIGDGCKLNIYENQQILFSLTPGIGQTWYTAQFYAKQSTMNLKFEAYITMSCNVSINNVSVVKGNCPTIECPRRTTSCNDGHFCVRNSQMCDLQKDCKDSSDEICRNSLTCDFEYPNNCGYKGTTNLYEKIEVSRNDSDYHIRLYGPESNWTSPMQKVNDSCIQFSYRGSSYARVAALQIYGKQSASIWESSFPGAETSWSVGQFAIPAGIVQLVFNLNGPFASQFDLDNIRLIPGSCPPLDCGKDYVPCAQNNKCVKKTEICNRQYDCMDKSDEMNCTSSLDCEFEHSYLCGYRLEEGWVVTSGKENYSPRHDHSTGTFYGHYMSQRFPNKFLYTPEITIGHMACVRFYYYLREDNSVFRVYDNKVSQLLIKSNNIDKWQMAQLQLAAGKHILSFTQTTMQYRTTLAIDSISTTPGRCPKMDCPDKWTTCSSADICVPYFRFCDGEIDCPNGEDEHNCIANSTIRLIRGQNVNQGNVEYRLNGTWNKMCYENAVNPSSIANAIVVCRELGYNGSARATFRTASPRYVISNIKHISCKGNEKSISECSMKYCVQCYCQHFFSVDCSNHHCLSDQVPCPGQNGKPYTNLSSCIWKYNLCDGEYDCPGGTDEQNCKECNGSEFRCRNRECIPQGQRCNGVPDCKDSSDEHDCFFHNETNVFMVQNGKYEALCENNIYNQEVANELCKAVGKGDGTILPSSKSGQGIKLMASSNSKEGIPPGYYPAGITSCRLLNLVCNLKGCGARGFMTGIEPNIRYGIFSLPGEWPWQVALYRDSHFLCGGTLISERYVLTAAHCVRSKRAYYVIRVGSVNRRNSGQLHPVKRIAAHPGFDMTAFRHDVALLELSTPVKINNFTQIACLPTNRATPNSLCFTTGWGQDEAGSNPEYLKEVKVQILTKELCMSYYKTSDGVAICANHPKPHQPACFGDSGGPLQCLNAYGHWDLVGATSYGRVKCLGDVDSPEAYADVYAHLAWIMENAPNLYH